MASLPCPHCKQPIAVAPSDREMSFQCPHCGGQFRVGRKTVREPAPAIQTTTAGRKNRGNVFGLCLLAAAVIWIIAIAATPFVCRAAWLADYERMFHTLTESDDAPPLVDLPMSVVLRWCAWPWLIETAVFGGACLTIWIIRLNFC